MSFLRYIWKAHLIVLLLKMSTFLGVRDPVLTDSFSCLSYLNPSSSLNPSLSFLFALLQCSLWEPQKTTAILQVLFHLHRLSSGLAKARLHFQNVVCLKCFCSLFHWTLRVCLFVWKALYLRRGPLQYVIITAMMTAVGSIGFSLDCWGLSLECPALSVWIVMV